MWCGLGIKVLVDGMRENMCLGQGIKKSICFENIQSIIKLISYPPTNQAPLPLTDRLTCNLIARRLTLVNNIKSWVWKEGLWISLVGKKEKSIGLGFASLDKV